MFEESTLCPAKINLSLLVGNREASKGFHRLESIFLKLGLYDHLKLSCQRVGVGYPSGLKIETFFSNTLLEHFKFESRNIDCVRQEIAGEEGIIRRTLSALLPLDQYSIGIKLYKNIPLQAGLGGGSSNAAGIIKILRNKLQILSNEEVEEVAANLGFDVQPFLINSASYSVYNEVLKTRAFSIKKDLVNSLRECFVLIVKPPIGSSTKLAYQSLGRVIGEVQIGFGEKSDSELEAEFISILKNTSPNPILIRNDFHDIIINQIPVLGEILNTILLSERTICHGLAGSGSSLFFVYPNFKSAKLAYLSNQEMSKRGCFMSISKILI